MSVHHNMYISNTCMNVVSLKKFANEYQLKHDLDIKYKRSHLKYTICSKFAELFEIYNMQ